MRSRAMESVRIYPDFASSLFIWLDYRSRGAGVEPFDFCSILRNEAVGDGRRGDIRTKLVAVYYREVRLPDIPET